MNLMLLGDRIWVEPKASPLMSEGGLHIPDAAREIPQEGTVLQVGRGLRSSLLDLLRGKRTHIQRGDTVIFGRYSGSELEIRNRKLTILRRDDVIGIIRE